MSVLGALTYANNDTLDRWASEDAASEQEAARISVQSQIAAYIQSCWQAARTARNAVTQRLLSCLRRRNGEYDPEKLAAIRSVGGSEIYMMLTEEKCNAAQSWISDILLSQGERPYSLKPTTIPTISPADDQIIQQAIIQEVIGQFQMMGVLPTPDLIRARGEEIAKLRRKRVMEVAKKKAQAMEDMIEDQFQEGGFYDSTATFVWNYVTYPAAFLKGPVVRKVTRLKYAGPNYAPEYSEDLIPVYYAPSPFDLYPAPSSARVGDGYLIELHRLVDSDLYAMIGVPGYADDEIRAVLEQGSSAADEWLHAEDSERRMLEGRQDTLIDPEPRYTAIQFWGKIPGRMLLDWGMTEDEIPDPDKPYDAEVWQIGQHTIRAMLNADPTGAIPYYKASFREMAGSFWGLALSELISDCQDMCNATARQLSENMGMSAGPQVVVDASQMPVGERYQEMYPKKVWAFDGRQGNGRKPIDFFQPASNAAELMQVYEKFSNEADNKSGVPKYVYGSGQASGALNTATGMSMMMNNAAKGIKQAVANIDRGVIEKAVKAQFTYNMLYTDDPSIKGDVQVIARGSTALVYKEQQTLRRTEALTATANPVDMQILGLEGRAALLRENFKGLDLDTEEIIPDAEELQMRQQMAAMMAPPPEEGGPQGPEPPKGAAPPPKPKQVNAAGDKVAGRDHSTASM